MKRTHNSILAEEARMSMHGRILRCPLGGNPVECPLHEVRKLPVEERQVVDQNDDHRIL